MASEEPAIPIPSSIRRFEALEAPEFLDPFEVTEVALFLSSRSVALRESVC